MNDDADPPVPAAAGGAPSPDPDAPRAAAPARLEIDRRMLEGLVCPVAQSRLDYDRERQELISTKARLAYPIRDGIPVMLVAEARPLDD